MKNTNAIPLNVIPLHEVFEVNNYPYGRLQCTMKFSIEYVKGKGYRSVTQSINPKTNRLNKPHKSTYSAFKFNYIEEGTNHVKTWGSSINGYDDVNKVAEMLSQYAEPLQMTQEQIIEICKDMNDTLIISLAWTDKTIKGQVRAVFADQLELIKVGATTGIIDFAEVKIDIEKINEIKVQKVCTE